MRHSIIDALDGSSLDLKLCRSNIKRTIDAFNLVVIAFCRRGIPIDRSDVCGSTRIGDRTIQNHSKRFAVYEPVDFRYIAGQGLAIINLRHRAGQDSQGPRDDREVRHTTSCPVMRHSHEELGIVRANVHLLRRIRVFDGCPLRDTDHKVMGIAIVNNRGAI